MPLCKRATLSLGRAAAAQVSSMYMVVPVKQGGETLFASTSAGFGRLDPALQEQVGSTQSAPHR